MSFDTKLADAKTDVENAILNNKIDGITLNGAMNTNIGDQIAALECKQVKQDVFIVNDSSISVPGSNVP